MLENGIGFFFDVGFVYIVVRGLGNGLLGELFVIELFCR